MYLDTLFDADLANEILMELEVPARSVFTIEEVEDNYNSQLRREYPNGFISFSEQQIKPTI